MHMMQTNENYSEYIQDLEVDNDILTWSVSNLAKGPDLSS